MWIAITLFWSLMFFYHIIVTGIAHGFYGNFEIQGYISIIKDALWIILFGLILLKNRKSLISYLKKYSGGWIIFFLLTLFSFMISLYLGKSFMSMLIGFKYSFYYIFIFLSASFIGYAGIKKDCSPYIKKGIGVLFVILILGYLWQGAKILFPDFFSLFGYGALNDYIYQSSPPIYYLTGYEGIIRRQGLFSGPNNYGYFLLAFFPIIYYYTIKFPKNLLKNRFIRYIVGIVFWGITIGFTIARSAFLGVILALCVINWSLIKKNKKIFLGASILLIGAFIGLSVLKYKSTIAHIAHKIEGIETVIYKPLGYGLGTSGPSIHHGGTYLPENYFVQILIDVGTIGFLIWSIFIFWLFKIIKHIKQNFLVSTTKRLLTYNTWVFLFSGFGILLFVGLFLHVFEDSMVNYLLFIPLGLLTGYLSQNHRDDSFE